MELYWSRTVNCFGIRWHNLWNTQSFTRWNKISFSSKFLYPTFMEKTLIGRATGVQTWPWNQSRTHTPPDTGKYYQTALRLIKCCRPIIRTYLSRFRANVDGIRLEIEGNAEMELLSVIVLFSVLYKRNIGNFFWLRNWF